MKIGLNQLKKIGEIGNNSNWLVRFSKPSSSSVSVSNTLNAIDNKWFPAMSVDYNQLSVTKVDVTIGPDLVIPIPVKAEKASKVSIGFYDKDLKTLRLALISWVENNTKLYNKHLAPDISKLKSIALQLDIIHTTKQKQEVYKDSYYVILDEDISFHGDYQFLLDTNTVSFMIVGYN